MEHESRHELTTIQEQVTFDSPEQQEDNSMPCAGCDGCVRVDELVQELDAPIGLMRKIAEVKGDLCIVQKHLRQTVDELRKFTHLLDVYANEKGNSGSPTSPMYPVARAIFNWQDTLAALISATRQLPGTASLLNIEMMILESEEEFLMPSDEVVGSKTWHTGLAGDGR